MALLPFVVYVVAVPFVVALCYFISMAAGLVGLETSEGAHGFVLVEYGYAVCIVALLIGALYTHETKTRRSLLILVIVALVLMLLLYPATQVAKAR